MQIEERTAAKRAQKSRRGQQHLLLVRTVRMIRFSKQRAHFLRQISGHDFRGKKFPRHGFRDPYGLYSPYSGTKIEVENREEKNSEFDFFSVWRRKRGRNFLFRVEISWSENFRVLL